MNDGRLEHALRSVLLEDDPGAPPEALRERVRAIPDAVTAPTRPLARWRRSLPAIAGAALVVVLAGLALAAIGLRVTNVGPSPSTRISPSRSPSASPSVTPGSPTPSASPGLGADAPHSLDGPVGFDGAAGWRLSPDSLWTSSDGGRHWTAATLPATVQPSDVTATAIDPQGTIWLAVIRGQGLDLYRADPPGPWSMTTLTPTWPSVGGLWSGPPERVSIWPGSAGLVTVVASLTSGMTLAVSSTFVSTDGGRTFRQGPAQADSDANLVWSSIAFVDAEHGVVVAGPTANFVFWTADGGASWSPGAVDVPAGISAAFGQPFVAGAIIELPVTTGDADGGESLAIYASSDGGRAFEPLGAPVRIGPDYDPPASVVVNGQTVWALGQGATSLEISADGGRTWTSRTTAGLSENASMLALTGGEGAVAVVSDTTCAGFKSDCTTDSYLEFTADGGATWSRP